MRLRADTQQTIDFIKQARNEYKNVSVSDACYYLKLSETVICRNLSKLRKAGLITRDRKGAGSKYVYPESLGMGDIVNVIEGIQLNENLHSSIIQVLNQTRV